MNSTMGLSQHSTVKNQCKIKHLNGVNLGPTYESQLVIQLPKPRFLRVLSRSLFLAAFILTFPCIGSIMNSPSLFDAFERGVTVSDMGNLELLDFLLNDLFHEGLLNRGDKALVVTHSTGAVIDKFWVMNDHEVHLAAESDVKDQGPILDATYDLIFVHASADLKLVDRAVKIGGVLAVQLSNDPLSSDGFEKPSNYEVVYMRRYDSTIVAMRKVALSDELATTKRKLFNLGLGKRKSALTDLEGVLFEPPRRALTKSENYLKSIKYLPELLGDSLEGYNRRVFVTVGSQDDNIGMLEWFYENYPRQNQNFEVHSLEMMSEDAHTDVSDWFLENLREEEYIVVKADADVAKEMLKRGMMYLVDELFLECSNQWGYKTRSKSKRAYWECLSLYGRLMDEGVAVHQWWG